MRIARLCDPEAKEPFQSFVHNTTTYVAIPHDAPSQLFVFNDEEPSIASIQVAGRELRAVPLDGKQTVIELGSLTQPDPNSDSFVDQFLSLIRTRRGRRPNCKSHTRLFAFQVVLLADTPDRKTLATYDFHVLCPREFGDACVYHRQLCHTPDVIAPDTISARTEGRCCPDCKRTRETRGDD